MSNRLSLRVLTALGFAGSVAAWAGCADTTGANGGLHSAQLTVRPVLPEAVASGSFDLAVDKVQIRVIRPPAEQILDTTAYFPPDSNQLAVRLRVPLASRTEQLSVSIELRSGSRLLFAGTRLIEFTETTAVAPSIPLQYVGPGSEMTSLVIEPHDSVLKPGDNFTFTVHALSGTTPLDLFYVGWSSSNPAVAPVDAKGTLRAPPTRGEVMLRAVSATGIKDSTRVSFSPPPSGIGLAGGDKQTGQAGLQLPALLAVRLTAPDQLGVPGIRVRFTALSGGRVADSLVITDAQGYARTSASLGPVAGAQSFEASAPRLPIVSFSATAVAGPPAAVVALGGNGQTDTVGRTLRTPLIARVTDAAGNPIGGVPVSWRVVSGGGSLVQVTEVSNISGIAFADYALGPLPVQNRVRVSLASGAFADFVATGVPGAPAIILIRSGNRQADTAGATLAPFLVSVTDALGNPLGGVTVTWGEVQGGGILDHNSSTTTPVGLAFATYRLPTRAGAANVVADVPGRNLTALFQATVLPATPVALRVTGGNAQTDSVTRTLAPFEVSVTDQFGNATPGALVSWEVVSGGGTLEAPTTPANADGVARGRYTLGRTPGVNLVRARLPSGATVTFTATGSP